MIRRRADLIAWAVAAAVWIGRPPAAASTAPAYSVAGGAGNALGWYGMQGERYMRDGRFSVFAGVGYAPQRSWSKRWCRPRRRRSRRA